jgi:hypothetical protein
VEQFSTYVSQELKYLLEADKILSFNEGENVNSVPIGWSAYTTTTILNSRKTMHK